MIKPYLTVGSSVVYREHIGGACTVNVHLDRMGSVVKRSEVTFWIGDNPIDGGPCPGKPGDDWESAVSMVEWWLSGNVKYRANVWLPRHGYSALYCTNMPGCNCEAHEGA